MKKALLTVLTIGALQAAAQTPTMVYDIDPGAGGSQPWMTTVFNNKLYFSATVPTTGREMWSYDGVGTPSLVYNLNPGAASSMLGGSGTKMAVLNGKLYFSGDNGTNGAELMVYDGVNPPSLAHDIDPGSASSNPFGLTTIGNKMYFQATVIADAELYVFDGTNPPVKFDIKPGVQGSSPSNFVELNGKVYFKAGDFTNGTEIFMYDPGTNSAGLAYDIEPGATSSAVFGLTYFNNKIYLLAGTIGYGRELYSYDGTTALRLTDVNPGAGHGAINKCIGYNSQIYFSGSLDGTSFQLYKYNPQNSTTALVYNIFPGANANIDNFIVYNNKLYFSASNTGTGNELWMHDGTSTGIVADINPGAAYGNIRDAQVYNDKLYFTVDNGTNGFELYSFTDTALSVQNVKLDGTVTVMPNPTTGDATLQLSLKTAAALNLQVTDMVGKLVWENRTTNYATGTNAVTIPLNGKASGTYFYRLTDSKGTLMSSGKVVRQ